MVGGGRTISRNNDKSQTSAHNLMKFYYVVLYIIINQYLNYKRNRSVRLLAIRLCFALLDRHL